MEKAESIKKVHDYIEKDFSEHLDRCREFLRQKSISATGEGIKETAQMVKGFIEEIGGTVRYGGDENFPIVYGKVDTGSPKTLIIYGMYDVQPVDEHKWSSPPFAA